jgi:hypothetical protein
MSLRALNARRPRVQGFQTVLVVYLSVALLTVSCSTLTTQPPLQDLHMPGVVKIPGLTGLQQHGQIDSLATYVPAGTTGPARLLFHIGTIYEVELDGSNLHAIASEYPCVRSLAASPDGRWVACQDERGVELSSLVPGVTPSSVQILADVTSEDFSSPTWSPDGRRLALISGSLEGLLG